MQFAVFIFGVFMAVVATLTVATRPYVMDCPPKDFQESPPAIRMLCDLLEQQVENGLSQEQFERLGDRTAPNAKRQDVDHIFLRFGRRLGL